MVWFQCEDCGENLKKPKLGAHFWKCSASKLSCIDCGQMFGQDTVQGHTQCISEAEKYGPKGMVKPSNATAMNTRNSNQKPEVDINVGLSENPPWFCSLCKTNATSRQALLLHADGKKHKGKARAFHAANQKSNQAEVHVAEENDLVDYSTKNIVQSIINVNQKNERPIERTTVYNKKRKREEADKTIFAEKDACGSSYETCNGEVVQAPPSKSDKSESNSVKKMKWKSLITASLKTGPNKGLKMSKLKKLVIKALKEAGVTEKEDLLDTTLEEKVNKSHKFEIVGKYVRLAPKS
uniref:U1-type domain-containing protein n=1 Tax=Kalanchoe fedtschenkoi TaxID=63787 RepID=A0A7N0UKQ3_KALFE